MKDEVYVGRSVVCSDIFTIEEAVDSEALCMGYDTSRPNLLEVLENA